MRTYDGDTFTVEIDGEEEEVRLLGVDTPELKANGTKIKVHLPTSAPDQAVVLLALGRLPRLTT